MDGTTFVNPSVDFREDVAITSDTMAKPSNSHRFMSMVQQVIHLFLWVKLAGARSRSRIKFDAHGSSFDGVYNNVLGADLGLLFVDLASKEGHDIQNLNVLVGFITLELQALEVRNTLRA